MNLQDQVKVVAIFIDEDRVKRAGPGENLRIRLSGVEDEDILSGFVLSSVGKVFCCLHLFKILPDIKMYMVVHFGRYFLIIYFYREILVKIERKLPKQFQCNV